MIIKGIQLQTYAHLSLSLYNRSAQNKLIFISRFTQSLVSNRTFPMKTAAFSFAIVFELSILNLKSFVLPIEAIGGVLSSAFFIFASLSSAFTFASVGFFRQLLLSLDLILCRGFSLFPCASSSSLVCCFVSFILTIL